MPYPTPHNSQVELLTGIPLDNSYRNSIWFANEGAQATYFLNHRKSPLEHFDCMYIRETEELRVNAPIQDCLDVNYVMWRNHAYSAKWFYAFVTECRYINANCTGLKIELDVLQTWYFDYQILPCLIERCHPASDNIGENIVCEPVDLGDLVTAYTSSPNLSTFNYWAVVAYTTFDWSTWQPAAGTLDASSAVFSGLKRTVIGEYHISPNGDAFSAIWDVDARTKLNDLVNNHAQLVDGLVALVIAPSYMESHSAVSVAINKPTARVTALGAATEPQYIPRNNKLYTAPYTTLMMTDGGATQKTYDFEDFSDTTQATFLMYSDKAPDQSVMMLPKGYKGISGINPSEMLIMSGFPQASWTTDAFKTYLAQNKASIAFATALNVGSLAAGIATGDPATIAGTSEQLGASFARMYDMKRRAPIPHGTSAGFSLMAVNEKAFRMYVLTPKAEVCRIIDNYFDLYGYAQNKIGRVNINARPVWTYTKTRGACAVPAAGSGCTASDLRKIQNIFDAGITYWADGYQVGDYSLDNRV